MYVGRKVGRWKRREWSKNVDKGIVGEAILTLSISWTVILFLCQLACQIQSNVCWYFVRETVMILFFTNAWLKFQHVAARDPHDLRAHWLLQSSASWTHFTKCCFSAFPFVTCFQIKTNSIHLTTVHTIIHLSLILISVICFSLSPFFSCLVLPPRSLLLALFLTVCHPPSFMFPLALLTAFCLCQVCVR